MAIAILFIFISIAICVAANTISVVPGSNALYAALRQAQAGDIIVLADGEYQESNKLTIDKPLTIQAAAGAQPVIRMTSRIETSASFTLKGVELAANNATEAIRMVPGTAPYKVLDEKLGFTAENVYNQVKSML